MDPGLGRVVFSEEVSTPNPTAIAGPPYVSTPTGLANRTELAPAETRERISVGPVFWTVMLPLGLVASAAV